MIPLKTAVCKDLMGLAGPFTKIARTMSKQWGVYIVPSGAECDTNGKIVRIPFTADYLPLEKRQRLHGMLDHEVCHVAEEIEHEKNGKPSPYKVFDDERKKIPVIGLLINIFEDIRIELKYEKQYQGVYENLRENNISCANEWKEKNKKIKKANWWKAFGAAIILRARGYECDWTEEGDIGKYLDLCSEEIEDSRKPGWIEDSVALSHRVYEKVKKHYEEPPGGWSFSFRRGKRKGKGKKGRPVVVLFSPADESAEALGELDFSEVGKKTIKDYVIYDARKNKRYIPHPECLKLDKEDKVTTDDLSDYVNAKNDVCGQISALRAKQRMVIMSWSRRRVVANLDHGDIDDTALSEVRTGNTRVFTDLTNKKHLNTAISGLVDCSGSMGVNNHPGCSAYYAYRTSIALAESWELIGIPNEWLGFTVNSGAPVPISGEDLEGDYICRHPLMHMIFKEFSEPLRRCRGRFAAIQGYNDNCDGESVLWAARRLATRPEKRKILFVISDGMPATRPIGSGRTYEAHFRMLQDHLRFVVKTITSSGIEVIGIGAGTDRPKAFYNKETGARFVHINDITTMATDIFKEMKTEVGKGMSGELH